MSPPTPSLHAGLPIGGYELVYPLGKGGMAEVWLGDLRPNTDGSPDFAGADVPTL